MRAFIFSLLLVSYLQVLSQDKPDFHQMWTSQSDGKKIRVVQVMDDSVYIYNSDPTKLSLRYVQRYATKKLKINEKEGNGFLVYEKDSADSKSYRRIEYSGLTLDSVSICEWEKSFEQADLAENPGSKSSSESKLFYTTEYFYYLKMSRSAPDLKKDEYVRFLKTVSEELKKPDIKANALQTAGKTTDQKMENYFHLRIRTAPFAMKIFPGNLSKAQKKFANDEVVKKHMQAIRPVFFVKPSDPQKKSSDPKATPIAAEKGKVKSEKEKP